MGRKAYLESESVELKTRSGELHIGARMEEEGIGKSIVGGGSMRNAAKGLVERVAMEQCVAEKDEIGGGVEK